jgi:putative flippase GtrA
MITRELAKFLVVGFSTVFIDFVTYQGLIGFHLMPVNLAKAIGFLTGTLCAYFSNRFWTFGQVPHVSGSTWRFSVLYMSSLAVNVFINSVSLKLLSDEVGTVQLAFLFSTGVSAFINFLGMKFFVFRSISAMQP